MDKTTTSAIARWKERYREANESLKGDSRLVRVSEAMEAAMPIEEFAKILPGMLRDSKTTPAVKARIVKTMMDIFEKTDAKIAQHDLAEFDVEDYYAAMFSAALKELQDDKLFFLSLCRQVFRENPEWWLDLTEDPPEIGHVEIRNLTVSTPEQTDG